MLKHWFPRYSFYVLCILALLAGLGAYTGVGPTLAWRGLLRLLSFLSMGFMSPGSSKSSQLLTLHDEVMFILVMVAFFVTVLLLRIMFRDSFRSYAEVVWRQVSAVIHDTRLEFWWVLTPGIVLLCIALPSFELLYAAEFHAAWARPDITVKVIGRQWYWQYETGDCVLESRLRDIASDATFTDESATGLRLLSTDNPLEVPVGRPIRFLVTSADVIHSWAVPGLGLKIDAIPGRWNEAVTVIFDPKTYFGQCSELCGVNHAFMPIEIAAIVESDTVEVEAVEVTSAPEPVQLVESTDVTAATVAEDTAPVSQPVADVIDDKASTADSADATVSAPATETTGPVIPAAVSVEPATVIVEQPAPAESEEAPVEDINSEVRG